MITIANLLKNSDKVAYICQDVTRFGFGIDFATLNTDNYKKFNRMLDSIFGRLFPSIWDCNNLPIWLTVDEGKSKQPQSYSYERRIAYEDGELKHNTEKITLNGKVVKDCDYLKSHNEDNVSKFKCKASEGDTPKLDWKDLYEKQLRKTNKIERENAELKAQVDKIKQMLNI